MVYLAELLVVMTDRLKIVRIRARKCAPRTRKQLNKRTTTRLSLSLSLQESDGVVLSMRWGTALLKHKQVVKVI